MASLGDGASTAEQACVRQMVQLGILPKKGRPVCLFWRVFSATLFGQTLALALQSQVAFPQQQMRIAEP